MGTVVSLAFKLTDGAGTTAAGVPGVPELEVCAFELEPHAASDPRAANPSIDFNANANLEWWLRRIELIARLPRFTVTTLFAELESIHAAIIEITYSIDFSNPPTCRHLRTTYV